MNILRTAVFTASAILLGGTCMAQGHQLVGGQLSEGLLSVHPAPPAIAAGVQLRGAVPINEASGGVSEGLAAAAAFTLTGVRIRGTNISEGLLPIHPDMRSITEDSQRGGGTPANDVCADAVNQDLVVGSTLTFTGDNTGATVDSPTPYVLVWHAFTTTGCADVTINYCVTGSEFSGYFANVAVQCSDFLTGLLSGSDDSCSVSFAALPAGTYYIPVLVDPSSTPVGPYTIQVSAAACASAPDNDACGGTPVNLALGESINFTGTTVGATNTGDFVIGSVLEGQPASVWHDFTTTECTDVTISYCGTTPKFQTYLSYLSPSCPAGNDYIPPTSKDTTSCGDGNVTFVYASLPPGTYHIPVMFHAIGSNGPYTIEVSAGTCAPPPTNDACGGTPVALAAGTSITFTGTTVGATVTGDYVPGSSLDGQGPSVWHDFTTTECTNVTVSYCGTAPTFLSYWMILTPSCPGGNDRILRTAYDTTSCGDGNPTIFFAMLPPGTYHLPVLFNHFYSNGPYSIVVSAETCAPPPANDACGGTPVNLAIGGSIDFAGTTVGATTNGDYVPNSELDSTNIATVWHEFTTTECANVTVSYCGTNPAFTYLWGFLAPSCPAGDDYIEASDHDDTSCGDGNYTLVYSDLPAGTYHLPVMFDGAQANGPYTIGVSAAECVSSVQELSSPNITVFPNPTTGDLTVSSADLIGKVEFELMDMTGRVVYRHQQTMSADQAVTLPLNGKLAQGTYTLRLISANGISSRPVMVK